MGIDRRELLAGLVSTVAAASLPAEGLAGIIAESPPVLLEDRAAYFRNHPCVWTWEELRERLAPHKAQILAFENRLENPARRASHSRGGRSRVRARIAARSDAG